MDVLFGDAEPGGRLAESFPVRASDLAASENFPTTSPTQVQYRETSYVGYRFHDTWSVAPRFPFGHGLTFTTFAYGDATVSGHGTDLVVSVPVTNTGTRRGSEVVQLYVHDVVSSVHRPVQELKAFARVTLEPGETRDVELVLGHRSFAVYDVARARWAVEAGDFELRVGSSSRDLRTSCRVRVGSEDSVTPALHPAGPSATEQEFAALLGHPVPAPVPLLPFTTDSTVEDLGQTWLGRRLRRLLLSMATKRVKTDDPDAQAMIRAVLSQMPLRGMVAASDGRLTLDTLDRVVRVLNRVSSKARRAG